MAVNPRTPSPHTAAGNRRPPGGAGTAALISLGVGASLLLAAGLLTLLRAPIGTQLLLGYFRAHGMGAAVRIDRIDSKGLSGALRIGPPGDPDLTVERME